MMKHSRVSLFPAGIFLLLIAAVPVSASLSTITGVSPAVGYADGTSVTVTITGVNFTTTEGEVRLEMDGESDIDATISSWDADTIVCKVRITSAKETGDWDVVVIRGYDDLEVVKEEAFTIRDAITLATISPESGRANDDSVDFTLTGTGLSDIETVYLYHEDYDSNLTADDLDVISSTEISGTFDLTDMNDDTFDVCVGDSSGTTECDLSFEIMTDEVGSIDISSNPSGAAIYIDGTLRGTTPESIGDLIEGSHKVILKKTGYQDWGKIVTVGADDTMELDAGLLEAAATAAPVPTSIPAPVRTTVPSPEQTPRPAAARPANGVPTPWAQATAAPVATASPVDPVIIIGAAGIAIGLVAVRRH